MNAYINLKDDVYVVKKEFEFHVPKRCVSNIATNPIVFMFGKVYGDKKDAFDVIQCMSTPSTPYSYEERDDRYVLQYKVGDMFCHKTLTMTIANVEIIYKLLSMGQVLEDMEYENVYYGLMNTINNNAKLDVPVYFYEYTIAALLRDAKDTSKMLRQTNIHNSFKSLSINQINMRGDAFVAVTSVDPETMIVSAMNASKDAATSPAKATFLM